MSAISPIDTAKWKKIESNGLNIVYEVTVDYGTFKNWAEQNKNTKEMKGFRPGKAPLSFFKDDWMFASARSLVFKIKDEEKLGDILDSGYSEKKFKIDEPIQFDLHIELYPNIPEINLKDYLINEYIVNVDKKDAEEAMKNWAASNSRPVEIQTPRKTMEKDHLKVDISILTPDGKKEKMDNVDLVIGKGVFQKEIEDKMTDKNVDDLVEHSFKIPEDSELIKDPLLLGKEIKMHFKIKEMKEPKTFEVNDEMAAFFETSSISSLTEKFEDKIKEEAKVIAFSLAKEEILEELGKCIFDVPLGLLREKYSNLKSQTLKEIGYVEGKTNLEELVKQKFDIDLKEFENRLVYVAERAARTTFLLGHLAKDWNINLSDYEIDEEIAKQKSNFPNGLKGAIKFFEENEKAKASLKQSLLEEKIIKNILLRVTRKENQVNVKELYDILTSKSQLSANVPSEENSKNSEKSKSKSESDKENGEFSNKKNKDSKSESVDVKQKKVPSGMKNKEKDSVPEKKKIAKNKDSK